MLPSLLKLKTSTAGLEKYLCAFGAGDDSYCTRVKSRLEQLKDLL